MGTTATVHQPTMRTYVAVWIALLAIVAVEVALTMAHWPTARLLAALLTLAMIEAGIGLLYFMHLRYERAIVFWCVVPAVVFALLLLDHIWPDANRMLHMRLLP